MARSSASQQPRLYPQESGVFPEETACLPRVKPTYTKLRVLKKAGSARPSYSEHKTHHPTHNFQSAFILCFILKYKSAAEDCIN